MNIQKLIPATIFLAGLGAGVLVSLALVWQGGALVALGVGAAVTVVVVAAVLLNKKRTKWSR